ncbi:MAG: hypothetical protein AAF708_04570 [Deinococcota bacterium]
MNLRTLDDFWDEIYDVLYEGNFKYYTVVPAANLSKDDIGFVGGGEDAVQRVSGAVGKTLPREFETYLRSYCPAKMLYIPEAYKFMQLISYDEVGSDSWQHAYWLAVNDSTLESITVIGEDSEVGVLVVDIAAESCPLYVYGIDANCGERLQYAAPTLSHGLYLLAYRVLIIHNYGAMYNMDKPKRQHIADMFQAKLDELTPGVSADTWHIFATPDE